MASKSFRARTNRSGPFDPTSPEPFKVSRSKLDLFTECPRCAYLDMRYAVRVDDERMDEWRDALRRGIAYLHKPTNILVRGGIDDVWVNPEGEFIVVDYKATSQKIGPSSEDDLYDQYKRQMEIYQWLF